MCVSSLCFSAFADKCREELQREQPELYQNLTKILNQDEQQIIQAVIVQADANNVAAQAVATATNGGPH